MLNGLNRTFAERLDHVVLYTMHRRVPASFEESYLNAPSFEEVFAATRVNEERTAVYNLYAPGEHTIWLDTIDGEILESHIRVKLHWSPAAPLIAYHHGLSEYPYTASWRRIFKEPVPAHAVCIQAPFHNSWRDPFTLGFASLQSVYQMFAGSLRLIELVQNLFEENGAAYTVLAGISWGGITSMLYEGLFQRTRAVAPMLSAPNLAEVMWHIAEMFGRPIPISRKELESNLNFTTYLQKCPTERVFPLLGKNDLFFEMDRHIPSYLDEAQAVEMIAASHITGMMSARALRTNILKALQHAEENPR